MRAGIDPKIDFAFKWVFGKEQNSLLLKSLINAVLRDSSKIEVSSLTLLDPFNSKEFSNDKLSILDVKARDDSGRQFDIEMQLLSEKAFANRILYYWANLHSQQLTEGELYTKLRPTIAVTFTNFVLFPDVREHCLPFELRCDKHAITLTDDILVVVLELPKFKKSVGQITSKLDQWLYFLCHASDLDSERIPENLKNPEICKAIEALIMLSQDDIERLRYQARQKSLLDEKSRLHSAHLDGIEEGLSKGREEGFEQGLVQGLEQGREQGLEQGLEQGREQGLEQGLAQGHREGLIENILFCQQVLGKTLNTEESLQSLSVEDLKTLSQQIQREVMKSRQP